MYRIFMVGSRGIESVYFETPKHRGEKPKFLFTLAQARKVERKYRLNTLRLEPVTKQEEE